MQSIFGLPTHALVVHTSVVLGPLLALATVVVMVVPTWRHRAGVWLLIATGLVAGSLVLATQSGEELGALVHKSVDFRRHQDLAEIARNLSLAWFVAIAAYVVVSRRTSTNTKPRLFMGYGVAVVGVATAVWIVKTGHEGARITWGPVMP